MKTSQPAQIRIVILILTIWHKIDFDLKPNKSRLIYIAQMLPRGITGHIRASTCLPTYLHTYIIGEDV